MKCSNTCCDRGLGLVSYRHNWFGRQRYCSEQCRNAAAFRVSGQQRARRQRDTTSYVEWLFSQPIGRPQPRLVRAVVRVKGSARCG